MNPPVIRYPFDKTGVNPNNLVTSEPQQLAAGRTIRVTGPNYGPFYQQGLVVVDAATSLPLTSSQYYVGQLQTMPTLQTGLAVYTIIMITDPTVSNNVLLTYQVVGGEYSASAQGIIDQINALNLDDRPVTWPAIIGKPDGFAPSAHLHDAGDIYGFEYIVEAINRIASAILLGDEASHDAIYQYIDNAIAGITDPLAALQAQLNAHVANFENPHQTTADQVDAYTKAVSDSNLSTAITTVNGTITANVNNLQGQINTKANSSLPFAFLNQTVQFADVHGSTGYFAGDVWAFVSDERLKENIRPVDDLWGRIRTLKGVIYNHNEFGTAMLSGVSREDEYMGFLAGDLKKAVPGSTALAAFDLDRDTGLSVSGEDYLTAKYERALPLAIEGVKDLDERLNRTNALVRELLRTLKQTAKADALEVDYI